jgi:hypothetical protein
MADPNSERLGKAVRKHIRIEVELRASFRIEGDEGSRVFQGSTKNISRGGVCLQASEDKAKILALMGPKMPNLQVSLYLDKDGSPIDFEGRTTWISSRVGWFLTPSEEEMPILMGMSFLGLAREDALKIDTFIEELISRDRTSIAEIEQRIIRRLNKTLRLSE